MKNSGHRRPPLPAGLTNAEREFFLELRRLIDIAGLSYRTLEQLTSSARSDTDDPSFYSKSQWGRWLNGQSLPPRNAVRRLASILAAEDVAAQHLLDLWSGTFAPVRQVAEPPPVSPADVLVGRDSEMRLLAGFIDKAGPGTRWFSAHRGRAGYRQVSAGAGSGGECGRCWLPGVLGCR